MIKKELIEKNECLKDNIKAQGMTIELQHQRLRLINFSLFFIDKI